MSLSKCEKPWLFMELRDLFGDGSRMGNLVRKSCPVAADLMVDVDHCPEGQCRFPQSMGDYTGKQRVVRVDPTQDSLPRSEVVDAVRRGQDLELSFPPSEVPTESILREVATLVRRLRTSGLQLTFTGLAMSVRARIARLEASLGRS
ncbi:MAG: hypothetical protein H6686_12250 [Fibrobacteria bacterium]|nr:hypothetical protein [Fibrobacteria bacterium]